MLCLMKTFTVTLITESVDGVVTSRVAEDASTQNKAMRIAKKAAGRGAEFFARGEDQYQQIGYVGPDGTAVVA